MTLIGTVHDVSALVNRLEKLLGTRDDRDHLTVPERLRASYNGWPAGSGDGPGSVLDEEGIPMPSVSDPTGEAALRPDKARDAETLIVKQLNHAKRALDQAIAEATRWTLRDATTFDADQSSAGEDGCESCARIRGPRTHKWWNPVYRTTLLANGARLGLCRWCFDWSRRTGELPPKDTLEAHRDGKRIKQTA